MCTVGLYVSLCLMIFLCPFLHCKALRTAIYKRYINSIIIIIIIINDNCRRSFLFRDVLILYISQESQDDCLYFDFALFKLALWPTLRRKFMNF